MLTEQGNREGEVLTRAANPVSGLPFSPLSLSPVDSFNCLSLSGWSVESPEASAVVTQRASAEQEENLSWATREKEDEEGVFFPPFFSVGAPSSSERAVVRKTKRIAHALTPSAPRSIYLQCQAARRHVPGTSAAVSRPREDDHREERRGMLTPLLHVGPLRSSVALALSPPNESIRKQTFSFSHPDPRIYQTTPREQSTRIWLQLYRERGYGRRGEREGEDGKGNVFSCPHHGRRSFARANSMPLHQSNKTKNASLSLQTLTTCTRPSLSTMGAFGSFTQPPLGGARWNAGLSGQLGGSCRRFDDCGAANIFASMPTPVTRCCALLVRCGLAACAATSSRPRPLRL